MPEALTKPRGGLFTKDNAPVPLAGVSIEAEISAFCARVTVTQRYVNRETSPIEAVYTFPLDEGAAVCGFAAIVDGTLVVGEVKEREEAFKTYDDAMQRGDGSYLLDEERPDVFQASVGNLPPGKEVLLKVTYVTELSIAKGAVAFSIPTTVSPRYAPAEDRVGIGRPDSETLNPPVAWRVPYGLDLNVRVTMTGAIARIESPSHPVSVSIDGSRATVALSQRDAALDRDFVLSIEAAGLDTPRGWIEKDDDGTEAVAVAFVPSLPDASVPSEIIFIVDRSGSMAGQSIREVRNALQLCLRSMIPGCSFNIVGFGSKFETLFRSPRAYDERSLAEASEHVAKLEADLGGTEILPALKAVLEQQRHPTLSRQVVILTDGEVTNTDAVLALAAEHAGDARIFAFGIGASASHHLVKGVARAGGGVAEFIYPGERIEPKVVRQFGRLLSPALTDVRVEWRGAHVTQAPSVVPPVFADGRLLLYGFANRRGETVRATLSANLPSGPVSFDVAIDANDVRSGRTVATLAARARIRELEESPAWTALRGSKQSHRKGSAVTQEIVALSTRYGLISRETSFVAVERRDTPVEGEVQLRRVPIALSKGWGAIEEFAKPPLVALRMFAPMVALANAMSDESDESMPRARSASITDMMIAKSAGPDGGYGDTLREMVRRACFPDGAAPRPQEAETRAPDDPVREKVQLLVRLQHADGSWDPSGALADVIGRDPVDSLSAMGLPHALLPDLPRVWATALALAWLDTHAGHLHEEWHMVAEKGRRWLDHAVARLGSGDRWVHEAISFIQR